MKPAKATIDSEETSFALKEQETGIVLDGVIRRAKESVFTHIRQSTDIVLVTSHNREGKSAFLAQLNKEIDSEIRSLSLHSDDLLNASNTDESSGDVDFSLISAIIYESIQLDEYLLINIDDADKLPIENFNDLVTLALSTNTKKNNIIFLFAGGPDLLSQVEQISNIRRLSIAHCTLDELMYEDLVEFIDLRQKHLPTNQQYNFDDQALKTIVTHASGSLFKAAVLLEWSREYADFNQDMDISAGTVSKLLSVLLNKSQVDGVNLFASYPTADFDFGASMSEVKEKKPAKPKQAKKRKPNSKSAKKESQPVAIQIVDKKSSDNKPNVYERVMADASEEELISTSTDSKIIEDEEISFATEANASPASSSDVDVIETANEDSASDKQVVENQTNEEVTNITLESIEEQVPNFSAIDSTNDEVKPLYIENTDLSLTKLVPKQGSYSKGLSSLQWTFIILIIGAILFYGGIMFIASNGSPDISLTADVNNNERALEEDTNSVTVNAAPINDGSDFVASTGVSDKIDIEPAQNQNDVSSPSILDRITLFFSSPAQDNNDKLQAEDVELNYSATEAPVEVQNKTSAISQKENTITALLDLAKLQMENKKLTSPASDNAVDTYRMVLQLDPKNNEATAGIESIRVRYLIWAEQQAIAGNSGKAKLYLELAKEMSTDGN